MKGKKHPRVSRALKNRRNKKQAPATREGVVLHKGNVFVEGNLITSLTNLEYRLMSFFVSRPGEICERFVIVSHVWGDEGISTVTDQRIEKLVSRLRSKIEADPKNPRYLVTIRGRGFKFRS